MSTETMSFNREVFEKQRELLRILLSRTANLADLSHRIAVELDSQEPHQCEGNPCQVCSPEWKAQRLHMMVKDLDEAVANFYGEEFRERA